jgi:hypothetical protein
VQAVLDLAGPGEIVGMLDGCSEGFWEVTAEAPGCPPAVRTVAIVPRDE